MKVYKFGGASVRNADGVRNLRNIIDDEQNLFIIVSAMGKTTNALEKVFEGLQKGDKQLSLEHVESLRKYHAEIIDELWHEPKRLPAVDALFGELEKVATETVYKPGDAELWYDTIVAYGELVFDDYYLRVPELRRGVEPLDRHAPLFSHRAAPQGRRGEHRGFGFAAEKRAGQMRREHLHRTGLHRRRARRHDHDPGARRLGLLGGRGGQHSSTPSRCRCGRMWTA